MGKIGEKGRREEGKFTPQPLLSSVVFEDCFFDLVWEDAGAGGNIQLTRKDKMSQHDNSHGHLPPCFLSPLHSNPFLCVVF